MSIVEQILLGIALAMDCLTVSITCGLIQKRLVVRTMLVSALMFGLFQAAMPLLGWLGMSFFSEAIEHVDHWIAFGLLAFIGGKMILDGFRPEEEERSFDPTKLSVTLTLAVATSIDAFAVGLSFVCQGMDTIQSISMPVLIIGLVSFLFSVAGFLTGAYAGKKINFPVEILGGVILVGIGIKILLQHILV